MRKKPANKKEIQNRQIMIIAGIVALFVLALILWSIVSRLDFLNDGKKAFQAGEETYTVAEVNYYYYTAYDAIMQSMQGYGQFAGLDVTKDLSEQNCPLADEEMSWRDYLLLQAEDRLAEISVLYQEALKHGYEADDAILVQVEQAVDYERANAADANLNMVLQAKYGGLEEKGLRRLLTQSLIAQAYENDWKADRTFTEEEVRAHYEEHLYEYTTYSYLYAYAGQQKEAADAILETKSEQEFRETSKELLGTDCYEILDAPGSELGDRTTEDLTWIADQNRVSGDTYLGKSGEDWYVLCYLGSNDSGFASGENDGHWKVVATAGLKDEHTASWKEELEETYGRKEYTSIKKVGR